LGDKSPPWPKILQFPRVFEGKNSKKFLVKCYQHISKDEIKTKAKSGVKIAF